MRKQALTSLRQHEDAAQAQRIAVQTMMKLEARPPGILCCACDSCSCECSFQVCSVDPHLIKDHHHQAMRMPLLRKPPLLLLAGPRPGCSHTDCMASASTGSAVMCQAEQQTQARAKEELKALLLSNEENKRLKEAAKEADRADNLRYMAQQAEIMAKEERVRVTCKHAKLMTCAQ